MGRTVILDDDSELTEEGKILWENIARYEKATRTKVMVAVKELPKLELDPYKNELAHIKLELERMITNSKKVIMECEEIIRRYTTAKEYLSSDAKIAKELHSRLVHRLQNILDGRPAFS